MAQRGIGAAVTSRGDTRSASRQLECPRCRQQAMGPAQRRGRCTACGAPLVESSSSREAEIRTYLYGAQVHPKAE